MGQNFDRCSSKSSWYQLGIQTDNFIFDFTDIIGVCNTLKPTKGNILRIQGIFYDPLGLISPITLPWLHGFYDSSEKAYCAVVYARILCSHGVKVTLCSGRSRVASVKSRSIPRLNGLYFDGEIDDRG